MVTEEKTKKQKQEEKKEVVYEAFGRKEREPSYNRIESDQEEGRDPYRNRSFD